MTKIKRERIFLSPPHMSGEEMRFVKEAFESNYIAPLGPQVDAFEREFAEYVGIKHCVALSSGTAAMHLALRILGVGQAPVECAPVRFSEPTGQASLSPSVNATGQSDEVIASSLTFIGSVTPVIFQGADLVFVDCDRSSWNMDPELLKEALEDCKRRGKMPKAVVPTDLYGQSFDYERILKICEEYGVPVVADAAESLGAKYKLATDTCRHMQTNINVFSADFAEKKMSSHPPESNFEKYTHAGKGAKASVFSFNGNKIITTSGGGMLASDDKEFIDYARKLSQQARDPFPHYEHTEIGYNYRMSNILAAIGRGQLRVLDERVKRKREIFDYYREALGDLSGIEFMPEADYGRCNRWLTVVLITPEEFGVDREEVRLALEEENIEARPVWKPMHMQPVFQVEGLKAEGSPEEWPPDSTGQARLKGKDAQSSKLKAESKGGTTYRARKVGGEVAEDLFKRGLCLPSGTAMTEEDLDRVVELIRDCRK